MLTRREFGKLALAAGLVRLKPDTTVMAARVDSTVNGVHLGVQTYSFRDLPRPAGAADSVDVVIKAMTGGRRRPSASCSRRSSSRSSRRARAASAARRRRPRRSRRARICASGASRRSLDHFRNAKKKFDAAGITIYAYCYNMNASFTDAEIDRGFEMTKALGTDVMTTSTTMDVAKRIAPLADKHKIVVGLHGHSNINDPNEFATPESFAAAMKMSKYFKVNLDIGHFTAANYDAVAYIREHHADITNLHLKDRKKNQGDNLPWGQGETPIREVLQLLKKEQWPIPADIEYEYRGQRHVASRK